MLTKHKWNLLKWHVVKDGVGTVFVGSEDDCDSYIGSHTSRPQRYTYQDLTASPAFEFFQEVRV